VLSEIHLRVEQQERVLITTLTKRMSEDLTEYLSEHGIKVRYLHSDVNTVERVEIIRDLRLGVFDVLVGINLLREGLDLPEVSLVAIFDADKEGFLRSDRSLIQTIGRAARNIHGKAILYANKITASMQRALEETDRRREKQIAHNQHYGIIPHGVRKAVVDILDVETTADETSRGYDMKVAEEIAQYHAWTPVQLAKKIKQLEQKMFKHAEDLEFEQAAQVRDEIKRLKELRLKMA